VLRDFDVDRNAAALASRIRATLAARQEMKASTSERATTAANAPEPVA
jgi:hypothetical protein